MLATDGALRQTGIKTHRIIGEADDPETKKSSCLDKGISSYYQH